MLGREDLDVNKLVYATDIDTMLVDCEGTEVWPQDGDGNEYYFKTQADNVMDAMEARIKELEAENERLNREQKQMEVQDQVVIDRLRKENAKLKCLALLLASEMYWFKSLCNKYEGSDWWVKMKRQSMYYRKAYHKAKKELRGV